MGTKKTQTKPSKAVPKNKKTPPVETPKKTTTAIKVTAKGVELITIAELSKRTKVSIRMLRTLQQQGIIEPAVTNKGKESLYNFAECLAKMFAHYRDLANNRTSTDSDEMKVEKLKQITAKRTLEEIKVKRIRGELHHSEDVKRIIGSMFSRIHGGLESFPLGVAPLLVGKTDAVKIAEEIRKKLSKILYEITMFDFETFTKTNADYISQLEAEEKAQAGEDDGEPD